MTQEHLLLSSPLIFFGATTLGQTDDEEELEWNFANLCQIANEAKWDSHFQQKIGLFFHWYDGNE